MPPRGIPTASQRGGESELAQKWARWLHNHCRMGDPHCFKARNLNKKKLRPSSTTLANAENKLPSAKVQPAGRFRVKILFCAF